MNVNLEYGWALYGWFIEETVWGKKHKFHGGDIFLFNFPSYHYFKSCEFMRQLVLRKKESVQMLCLYVYN